ncbi:PmoA family protein [bacterium]|nr:PmoA family protein [bacterium]
MPHPRCTLLPLPDHQVAFLVDGAERLRWHFGPQYPRPFFYPLAGPSGLSLTRMGHPGAPDHDHHRSVWFAHEKVAGVNFWGDTGTARVRQKQWLAYDDGDTEAVMAVRLGWFDGHDPRELLTQDLFAAVIPGPGRETFVELQTTFRPTANQLEFAKTNFGFLAVRVAKAISAHFGGGTLTNSDGAAGEPAVFGKPARWVDYSGEQPGGHREGVTYFDHPTNPGHPAAWHVREDGWMGASACFAGPRTTTQAEPLTLRYLLHAHAGLLDARRAEDVFAEFGKRPPFELVRAPGRHVTWGARRRA